MNLRRVLRSANVRLAALVRCDVAAAAAAAPSGASGIKSPLQRSDRDNGSDAKEVGDRPVRERRAAPGSVWQ